MKAVEKFDYKDISLVLMLLGGFVKLLQGQYLTNQEQ